MSMRGGAGKAIGLMSKEKAKLTRPLGVLVKALGGFMKGIGKLLLGAAFFSLIYAATQLISPLILTKGMEAFPENNSTGIVELFGIEMSVANGIITLVAVFGVLGILGFLLNSFSIRILSKANSIMVNDIRVQLYSKLINSSMDYIKNEQSGNITARITSDTDQIATGIHVFTIISIQLVLLVATFVLVLVKSGWEIILISLASVPIALLISAVLSRVGRKIVLRIRKAFGIASGKMAESFSGVAVSKSFNREEELSGQMSVLNQQYYKMSQKFGLMMNITMPLIAAISTLTVATILWVGGKVGRNILRNNAL
ncbi:MAG: ABC transporter transmembrane domain-containing protein [Candidatus Heimdallarchaeota archaeon]